MIKSNNITHYLHNNFLAASSFLLLASLFIINALCHAEFAMNFTPGGSVVGGGAFCTASGGGYCTVSNGTHISYSGGNFSDTLELDPVTGIPYYHVIVDDPANHFKQETYVRAASFKGAYQGGPASMSFGDFPGSANSGVITLCTTTGGCLPQSDGSYVPYNTSYYLPTLPGPLSTGGANSASGNGTGSAGSTLIRQVVGDAGGSWNQEFLKASYTMKPKITETQTNADFTSSFVLDMSNLDYNTNTTPATLTYTMNFANGTGDFNYATDKQDSYVTGGRYKFDDDKLGNTTTQFPLYMIATAVAYGTQSNKCYTFTFTDGTTTNLCKVNYHYGTGYSYIAGEKGIDPAAFDYKKFSYDPRQNAATAWTGSLDSPSPTIYGLVNGHWATNTGNTSSNINCNSSNLSCPSWQGW